MCMLERCRAQLAAAGNAERTRHKRGSAPACGASAARTAAKRAHARCATCRCSSNLPLLEGPAAAPGACRCCKALPMLQGPAAAPAACRCSRGPPLLQVGNPARPRAVPSAHRTRARHLHRMLPGTTRDMRCRWRRMRRYLRRRCRLQQHVARDHASADATAVRVGRRAASLRRQRSRLMRSTATTTAREAACCRGRVAHGVRVAVLQGIRLGVRAAARHRRDVSHRAKTHVPNAAAALLLLLLQRRRRATHQSRRAAAAAVPTRRHHAWRRR
mmetsp:Transcript_1627/g.4379  ORF Transcript_1627/g.4379 Transcript_1627/m.4379 type:complete len:273 (-) Transcript_1627:198-1016(-)